MSMQYAMTKNNLRVVCGMLAEIEDKIENCKRPIDALKEALIVFTKEEFTTNYQSIERNLRKLFDFCGYE
jgi:hypothetical protein